MVKSRLRRLVVAIAATFLFAGCDGGGDPVLYGDHGPGTYWVIEGTVEHPTAGTTSFRNRVTVVGHETYDGRQVMRRRWSRPWFNGATDILVDLETSNRVAEFDADGTLLVEYTPHSGRRNFPLEVSGTWRASYEYVGHDGVAQNVWRDYEVLAFVTLHVEAGSFEVYHVGSSASSGRESAPEEYWYSVEHRTLMRYRTDEIAFEVVEFELKQHEG